MSKSGKKKILRKFANAAEITNTQAESRSAPPIDMTDAYGASACENAILIQEKPPNGK